MESFDGAVLICDITGFTQLTEQLSKQGPSGVEQLTKCMNNYFTKVLCASRAWTLSMTPHTAFNAHMHMHICALSTCMLILTHFCRGLTPVCPPSCNASGPCVTPCQDRLSSLQACSTCLTYTTSLGTAGH